MLRSARFASSQNGALTDVVRATTAILVAAGVLVGPFALAATAASRPHASYQVMGSYVSVTPFRITDTRPGSGQPNAGGTLGPNTTLDVQVTRVGLQPIPAGSSGGRAQRDRSGPDSLGFPHRIPGRVRAPGCLQPQLLSRPDGGEPRDCPAQFFGHDCPLQPRRGNQRRGRRGGLLHKLSFEQQQRALQPGLARSGSRHHLLRFSRRAELQPNRHGDRYPHRSSGQCLSRCSERDGLRRHEGELPHRLPRSGRTCQPPRTSISLRGRSSPIASASESAPTDGSRSTTTPER